MSGRMIHSKEGELIFQPYGTEEQAIYSISRGGLNKILMSYAERNDNVTFHFNERCMGMDAEKGLLHLQNTESGLEHKEVHDIIFGADGAFSEIRHTMQTMEVNPNDFLFNFSQDFITHGYKELHIQASENGDFLMEKNALHIWPRGQFMLIALPNPDGSFTCTLFLPFNGPESFSTLQNGEQVIDFFNRYFKDAVPLMPTLNKDFFENPSSSLGIIKCFPWTFKDKVCLIGDAAHAIVPFYGQGMIAGFEDCDVLDDVISEIGDDWNQIFREYEKARKPNGDAIADLALRNFIEMRDLVGDPDFLLRKKVEKRIYELYPEKFVPLYSMVAFSNMPYNDALQKGNEQDKILDEIMAIENIEGIYQTPEFEQMIHKVLGE